jgi:hypothetical protein
MKTLRRALAARYDTKAATGQHPQPPDSARRGKPIADAAVCSPGRQTAGAEESSMGQAKGGQDLTRNHPGGSRTETKITEQSELGSDNSAQSGTDGNAKPDLVTGHRQRRSDEVK